MHAPKPLIETNRWRWSKRRERVMRRDAWTCQLCGEPAQEVDHIIPRLAGGTDAFENLRAICKPCHKMRGAGVPDRAVTRARVGEFRGSRYSFGRKKAAW